MVPIGSMLAATKFFLIYLALTAEPTKSFTAISILANLSCAIINAYAKQDK